MKYRRECEECSRRQAERVFSLAVRDPEVRRRLPHDIEFLQKEVGQKAVEIVKASDPRYSPAEVSFWAILEAHRATGCDDPFRQEKAESNELALKYYPRLSEKAQQADDPILTACLLAASGNIIDLGIQESFDLETAIHHALEQGFRTSHYDRLKRELEKTDRNSGLLLYILDNAGEIVFDRILIEQIRIHYPSIRIIASVNSRPVLNDALMEDAQIVGLCDLVEVIENGHQDLGTVLSRCSREFHDIYFSADLIISKGQANYETLDERPENIFFILKAKCEIVAESLGVAMYDAVLLKKSS
ncbi:MAG TPA: ARMT1-like domain-containing protein [bacterium]|nr:ARMT1-like domain-containing protein [bacterium]